MLMVVGIILSKWFSGQNANSQGERRSDEKEEKD